MVEVVEDDSEANEELNEVLRGLFDRALSTMPVKTHRLNPEDLVLSAFGTLIQRLASEATLRISGMDSDSHFATALLEVNRVFSYECGAHVAALPTHIKAHVAIPRMMAALQEGFNERRTS